MFANLATKRKLEEATSPQDDVTPVYVLDEVWNLVNSSGTDIQAMLEFLNKRLGHKSPVVKAKGLRLIKFVCSKGASEFKRGFSKNAGSIRELLHYRGEPDPFKGDIPNQKVREAAKEALDAVFAPTDTTHHVAQTQPAYQARIQGFGSSAGSDGPSTSFSSSGPSPASTAGNAAWGGSSSGSKYVGFGNPRFEAARAPQSKPQALAQGVMNSKSWATAASQAATAASALASKGQAVLNLKGIQGLMRDEVDMAGIQEKTGYSSGEEGSYLGPAALPSAPAAASSLSAHSTAAPPATEGEEQRLVDGICTPGGLRAQPDRADLQTFVESIGHLNGERIVELLTVKMDDGPWQATLRAICVLEAIIQMGATEVCGKVAVAFQTQPQALQKAASSPLASVRQRAAKVLGLLGVQSAAAPAPGPAAKPGAAAPAAAPVPDLMGGFDEEPAAAPFASGADMLGDLMGPDVSVSTPTSVPGAQHAQSDMFQGLSAPAPPLQAQQGSPDLFGGLSSSAGPPQPTADPFATMSAPSSSAAVDLMGGFDHPAVSSNGTSGANHHALPPAAPPAGTDFFISTSVGGTPSPRPAAPTANGTTSSAADNLAGLFTGLSTDAHGSHAGIPGLVKASSHAAPRLGQLLSQGSGSGLGQPMGLGAGRLGSSPGPGPRPSSPLLPGAPGVSVASQQPGMQAMFGQASTPLNGMPSPLLGLQPPAAAPFTMQNGLVPGMAQQHWPQPLATPQQAQYIAMLQHQAQLQQLQMMQQQQQQHHHHHPGTYGLLGGQQHQQMSTCGQGLGPGLGGPAGLSTSLTGAVPPIPLETFQGPSTVPLRSRSSSLGVASAKDFDFVGEHLSTLRNK